jgi:hypothetical protein
MHPQYAQKKLEHQAKADSDPLNLPDLEYNVDYFPHFSWERMRMFDTGFQNTVLWGIMRREELMKGGMGEEEATNQACIEWETLENRRRAKAGRPSLDPTPMSLDHPLYALAGEAIGETVVEWRMPLEDIEDRPKRRRQPRTGDDDAESGSRSKKKSTARVQTPKKPATKKVIEAMLSPSSSAGSTTITYRFYFNT